MDIKNNIDKIKVSDLSTGDCFLVGDRLFMKFPSLQGYSPNNENFVWAINLTDNIWSKFPKTFPVISVFVDIEIKKARKSKEIRGCTKEIRNYGNRKQEYYF